MIENDFIKADDDLINDSKIYCFKSEVGSVYKLSRVSSVSLLHEYMWIKMNDSKSIWSSNKYTTLSQAKNDVFTFEIKEFDSIQEAMNFYYPKETTKIDTFKEVAKFFKSHVVHKAQISGTSICNILHDSIDNIHCSLMKCADCPLNESI